MVSVISSKYVLTFLWLLSSSAVGQQVRGGGNPGLGPNRCDKAVCPMIRCAPDFLSTVPEGKCCPECVPSPKPPALDCSKVQCRACAADHDPVMVHDTCCPDCKPKKPDCRLVKCARPACKEGFEPVVPNGQCCPVCKPKKPDCRLVKCALPVCKDGFEPVVPVGQCCPVCKPKKPDCSLVRCARPDCKPGFEPVVPEGQCCPVCKPKKPDCSMVSCAFPVCKPGFEPVVPDGMCCPVCKPKGKKPCPMVACADPCSTFSTDQKAFAPVCPANQECVTEMVHQGEDENDADCPSIDCPSFVACE